MSLEETIAAAVREAVRAELAPVIAELRGQAGAAVLSTEQAASLAGVTAKTIREWIAAGLPAGRRGRLRTILRSDLERWRAGERPGGRTAADLLRGRSA